MKCRPTEERRLTRESCIYLSFIHYHVHSSPPSRGTEDTDTAGMPSAGTVTVKTPKINMISDSDEEGGQPQREHSNERWVFITSLASVNVTHHFPLFSPKPSAGTVTVKTPRIKDKPMISDSDEEGGQPQPKSSNEK